MHLYLFYSRIDSVENIFFEKSSDDMKTHNIRNNDYIRNWRLELKFFPFNNRFSIFHNKITSRNYLARSARNQLLSQIGFELNDFHKKF